MEGDPHQLAHCFCGVLLSSSRQSDWARPLHSAAQLKTMQEVITLMVFCIFSVVYLKEELKWNYIIGFLLIAGAVFFVFKKW